MKKFITTLLMAVMILTGVNLISVQKAAAAEDIMQLQVNGEWSQSIQRVGKLWDDEIYRFVIPSDGELSCSLRTSLDNGIYVRICDNNMTLLEKFSVARSTTDGRTTILSAGTYYILVGDLVSNGSYRVRLNFTPYSLNDQKAISYESPQLLSLGQPVNGALTKTDTEDWFKIIVPKAGEYTLSLTANMYAYGYLYNYSMSEMPIKYYVDGSKTRSQNKTQACQLEAGTYYIKVQAYNNSMQGKYTVSLTPKACTHSYTVKKVKATYFSQGYSVYTCSNCGKVVKKNYTAKLTIAQETIAGISGGKKKFAVRWTRIKNVTGYQVRYTTDKNFKKSIKSVKITGASSYKKTITGLKTGKTYYVQVRAYAKQNGKIVCGKWSAKKQVKVK